MLEGYGWLHREVAPDLVVKLDTDALVVAPFVDRVAAALDTDRAGMAGTYRQHCDGSERSVEPWDHRVGRRRFHIRPFREEGFGIGPVRVRQAIWGEGAVVRRRIAEARRNGYRYGDHCLGGGYAVSRHFLERMAERGWFADWHAWIPYDIGEDVCIGIYVHAVDLDCVGANQPGQPFGVEYHTLPCSPAEIVDAGYAVIHSIKDPAFGEPEVRAFFAARRAGTPG
jgi:cellulose synthase/poly-beta-1,6-N-acetylglucosamine synthase-like glycosyltransferase